MINSKTKLEKTPVYVFKKYQNIGAADAADDKKFLAKAFIDNGAISLLMDIENPQCIVVGRTGAGKTALLDQIAEKKEHVIKIAPESLALTYISNSDILAFFTKAGVNMDLFYRLLWRHVFAVEVIGVQNHLFNKNSTITISKWFQGLFSDSRKRQKRAELINYFEKYGDSFWNDTEQRVREVTKKLEDELSASIGGGDENLFKIRLNAAGAQKITEEQKIEVVNRGQAVVNKVQMKVLTEMMELLDQDILIDEQKKYYIVIDRLDESWTNNELRVVVVTRSDSYPI